LNNENIELKVKNEHLSQNPKSSNRKARNNDKYGEEKDTQTETKMIPIDFHKTRMEKYK